MKYDKGKINYIKLQLDKNQRKILKIFFIESDILVLELMKNFEFEGGFKGLQHYSVNSE